MPDRRLAVFDALADPTAIVDRLGTISHVNAAWATFAELNGGGPQQTGVGVNYLQVCRSAVAAGDIDARAVAAGLEGVLTGVLRSFEHLYPCPSPVEDRWFLVRITPLADPVGALIAHLDVTASKLSTDRLVYRASHDALTGLPTRDVVLDHLQTAIARLNRTGAPVAVLFLDLDGFKPVNDVYGHATGDRVLVGVANRLRRQLRATDIVGRVGGDEFLAVCDADDAEPLACRLREAVSAPFQVGGDVVRIGVSIGVTVMDWSGAGEPPEITRTLLAQADKSMYADKARRAASRVRTSLGHDVESLADEVEDGKPRQGPIHCEQAGRDGVVPRPARG